MDKNNESTNVQGTETTKVETTANNVKKAGAEVRQLGKNLPAVQQKALSLAQTIKTVTDLNTKVKHLNSLEAYSQKLENFTVKKKEEDLDTNINYYTGCKFELRDDDNQIFTLKHPVLVKEVIDFVKKRLDAKRAEIEATIKLPINTAA